MVIVHRSLCRAAAVLAAALVSASGVAPGHVRAAPPKIFHITPDGAGSQDGTSWRTAGTLVDLPQFIAQADPGDEVWIRGDLGPYETSAAVPIAAGGAPGAPITVRGVAGNGTSRATPSFIGTRTSPFRADGNIGVELFKVLDGADHLRFVNMAFENQGNGVFRIGADVRDLQISDMTADNVNRFVENYVSGDGASASIDGLRIEDVRVHGFSKSVVRLKYATNDVVIRDVYGDSERQDGHQFAMGVHLEDAVHHVVLDRVTMLNSHDSRGPDEYWNGDGFVAEPGTHHILLRDTVANGSTDSGYDLKGSATTLVRPVAQGNKRNFRFWGQATVFGCVAADPVHRGGTGGRANVWAGTSAYVRLIGCTFRDGDAEAQFFDIDDNARVTNVHEPGAHLAPTDVSSTATLRQLSLVETACPGAPDHRYVDVDGGAHELAIACLAERGIARGTTMRTFAPSVDVTRGQMASFVARLIEDAGGELPAAGRHTFDDVAGTTHQVNIEQLSGAGLVNGFDDGRFRPSARVTRLQMASLIDRTYTFVAGAPLPAATFDAFDDDRGSVHEQAINRLARAAIVIGDRTGAFSAAHDVQRAQMATFLTRLLGVLSIAGA